MSAKVTLKWGKNTYELEVPPTATGAEFKALVEKQCSVPGDRQKLLAAKLWSGTLKDETNIKFDNGAVITLMGSAEVVQKPTEKIVFVEDMSRSEIVKRGDAIPAGFVNEGNTCYLNSTLQCVRYIPELRDALSTYKSAKLAESIASSISTTTASSAAASGRSSNNDQSDSVVTSSVADLLHKLDHTPEAFQPVDFLNKIRTVFPKFAETTTGPMMAYKQQDAEEFVSTIINSMANELKYPTKDVPAPMKLSGSSSPANVVDALMGIEMDVELTCDECADEPKVVKKDASRKLVCNIDGGSGKSLNIAHLHEGIGLALKTQLTKQSAILGRDAVWTQTTTIAKLPKVAMVQFMRFFWKTVESRDGGPSGVPCKILKQVSFPATNLDLAPFCSGPLKDRLYNARRVAENARNGTSTSSASSSSASTGAAAGVVPKNGVNPDSEEFQGFYDLFGIVTHKGRNSSSGHYIAFVRKDGTPNTWYVFDDDNVTETDTEYVTTRLKGGGDDHMAYLAFYKASK